MTAGKLVYVVDDDEEQLMVMRLLLGQEGYGVVTESNADRVMAGVKSLMPDIILLDVMLPSQLGLDGFQLCQQIKQTPELAHIKVLMVSAIARGVGQQREKLRAQLGADDFFMKPYDLNDLLARVRELVSA